MTLTLTLLGGTFVLHRLGADADLPTAALRSPFLAAVRTGEELSLVLPESVAIDSDRSEPGWACFKVEGPLDFSQVGILAGIAGVLAGAQVPIFAVSTFDTDYILVKREQAQAAVEALSSAGYTLNRGDT